MALAAAAVVKGVGFAPQLVLEAYEALQASITSREPYVRLSELFRMEQHPRSVHNGGWLAEMFDDTASLDEHADLVDRAQQLFTMTLPVLAERAEIEADTHLMGLLGGLFGDLRRLDQSEDWYTKAAEFGDTTAMLTVAALLEEWGRAAEAEQWHRRAAELGRTDAMILLAERLAADASRQAEAEELYYRAAAAGDVAAMTELARRADDRGAVDEAEMWHRNALYVDHANGQDLFDFFRFGKNTFWTSEKQEELAESGDVRAMRCRALDLRKQGDVGAPSSGTGVPSTPVTRARCWSSPSCCSSTPAEPPKPKAGAARQSTPGTCPPRSPWVTICTTEAAMPKLFSATAAPRRRATWWRKISSSNSTPAGAEVARHRELRSGKGLGRAAACWALPCRMKPPPA
ncbi:hypothetical protein DMB37_28495 [Nocardia sp. CS682]|nr:hypothetical protein DMB37_28495 [Nocardia sp. CS682]